MPPKATSTNALNKKEIDASCGVAFTLSLIGGRWKPAILWALLDGRKRYSELKRTIHQVSERMLTAQLRELEEHGLISRHVFPEVPPRVEYELTELGWSMKGLLQQISDWGDVHRQPETAQL
ncbi:helix-turn-helix domain-containing protein [uncultured Chitinophaga sp.]|uniref:winged helix-turn-helix transcriptional regulator n=1 Tax=uncultured Chitinophaga sp. TaxID=339340 RepID=UPI0025D9A03C|nr:helix-turn-helix domain-containing protein [uncultured Chitinophaga sp.]